MIWQLQTMTEFSIAMDKAEIDFQLQLFSQQMAYQRLCDLQMHETSIWVNENAWLALEKQGDMVNYLFKLTSIIGKGIGILLKCGSVHGGSSVFNTNDQGGIGLSDHGFHNHIRR